MQFFKRKSKSKYADLIKNVQKETEEKPRKDNMNNLTVVLLFIYFGSLFYIVSSFPHIDLSAVGLLKLLCLTLAFGLIIPIKFYRKKFTMSIYEYLIFNLLAFAPALLSVMLLLNNIIIMNSYKETYHIVSQKRISGYTIYELQDNAYQEKEYLRRINDLDLVSMHGSEKLTIHFSEGLFGIRYIDKKELH